ncbi:unnamed protein product [Cylindrotheca closterium]|uniref:Chloride channel protein n=1 Tax=Cylindrotheca closterium TaxID=2856 RepID=A0AAD2FMS3_9STRA|nr:unnamed protein product [Cylindrotheca closterium]
MRPTSAISLLFLILNGHGTSALITETSSKGLFSGGAQKRQLAPSFASTSHELPTETKQASIFASASSDTAPLGEVPASLTVGVITAAMGFVYGKVLSTCVSTVWHRAPSLFFKRFGSLHPTYFITATCTVGGILMGLLSAKFSSTFTVADFVASFSNVPAKSLPESRVHLFPLLLLSLVTSSFGFSVGPEAPMVCAGALLGSSLAKYWYGNAEASKSKQEVLAYAGAAGALTAFMGIPIAGSIFALELTRSNAGLAASSDRALSPSILSSIAAITVIRGILLPAKAVGGHFAYGSIDVLSGRTMMATAAICGLGGAFIGTIFHKLVHLLKDIAWPASANDKKRGGFSGKRQVMAKALIGLTVGILSSKFPQTLFWGEGSLQCVVDGQATAFAATKHGISNLLTSHAQVNPNLPFETAFAAMQVGVAKLISIALACAGKFPGGIIFPLFFAAAPIAHAACSFLGSVTSGISPVVPLAVMCLMAATQASVTRTPLATVLMLSLSASAGTELSPMLPACLVSSYLGVYLSRKISKESYFQYSE